MKERYSLEYFSEKYWSFVLIKNNRIIFKSRLDGLKPLIYCIKKHKKEIREAIVFDKIVGRAAAILLVFGKVKEVWTPTISRSGKAYLTRNKVKIDYNNLAIYIKTGRMMADV